MVIDKNRPRGENHFLWKGKNKKLKIRDPLKEAARWAVHNAIKRGFIKRLPCGVCGIEKSEAHHKDYLKKLDIEWLCRVHHRQADYRDGTKSGDFGH